MQTKATIAAIFGVTLLICGTLVYSNDSNSADTKTSSSSNIVIENGVQYIDITARGGYTPRVTKAKAGIPTVIRMKTEYTYDCSTALVIPDIGYRSFLSQTGVEEIEIPIEKTKGTLRGMCSMAMYHFEIDFE